MPFLDDLSTLVTQAQKEVGEVDTSREKLSTEQAKLSESKKGVDAQQKLVDEALGDVQKETADAIASLTTIVSRVNEEIAKLQTP